MSPRDTIGQSTMNRDVPERAEGEYAWLLALALLLIAGPVALLIAVVDAPAQFLFLKVLAGGLTVLAIASAAVYLYVVGARRRIAGGRRARAFLFLALGGLVAFPVGVVLHNVISGLAHVEEPVFFVLAVLLAPLAMLIGAVGAFVAVALAARRSTDISEPDASPSTQPVADGGTGEHGEGSP
jgi:hypothetical protein